MTFHMAGCRYWLIGSALASVRATNRLMLWQQLQPCTADEEWSFTAVASASMMIGHSAFTLFFCCYFVSYCLFQNKDTNYIWLRHHITVHLQYIRMSLCCSCAHQPGKHAVMISPMMCPPPYCIYRRRPSVPSSSPPPHPFSSPVHQCWENPGPANGRCHFLQDSYPTEDCGGTSDGGARWRGACVSRSQKWDIYPISTKRVIEIYRVS